MLQQRNAENNSILIYVREFRIENKNTLNEKKKNKLNGWENIMQNQWTGEPKQESPMTGLNLVIK